MLTMKEILERIAEAFMALLLWPLRALGLVAGVAGEAWRQSRVPEQVHHANAADDDEETRRLMAEAARLDALALATEGKPSRKPCGSRDDPESGAPAAPAPGSHGVVPAARPGHRLILVELPADDEAEALGLDTMLPVLR